MRSLALVVGLGVALVAALGVVLGVAAGVARAEYAPDMEPGRLRVRHASWAAALACEAHWPEGAPGSVNLQITLDRRGRTTSVRTDPDVRAFARCVRRTLRRERFEVTGPDAAGPTWTVTSRFVFPD